MGSNPRSGKVCKISFKHVYLLAFIVQLERCNLSFINRRCTSAVPKLYKVTLAVGIPGYSWTRQQVDTTPKLDGSNFLTAFE